MRQDSYDIQQWCDWVNREGLPVDQRFMLQCMDQVLSEYFQSRENLPGKSVDGLPLKPDFKTTEEIVADTAPMMEMDPVSVVVWLKTHGFHMATLADGSVKWAIWRDMRPLM
ncbi:MAG: hypothetical protein PUF37_05340 [Prevotellaceae bacterium]|nr:hypothetical protein [Prevotellaceae bacterium]